MTLVSAFRLFHMINKSIHFATSLGSLDLEHIPIVSGNVSGNNTIRALLKEIQSFKVLSLTHTTSIILKWTSGSIPKRLISFLLPAKPCNRIVWINYKALYWKKDLLVQRSNFPKNQLLKTQGPKTNTFNVKYPSTSKTYQAKTSKR